MSSIKYLSIHLFKPVSYSWILRSCALFRLLSMILIRMSAYPIFISYLIISSGKILNKGNEWCQRGFIFLRHHKCSAKLPPERLPRAHSPTTLLKHLLSFNKHSLRWEGQLSHAFLLNNVTEAQLAVRWRLGSVPPLACVTLGKSFPFPEPPRPPSHQPAVSLGRSREKWIFERALGIEQIDGTYC